MQALKDDTRVVAFCDYIRVAAHKAAADMVEVATDSAQGEEVPRWVHIRPVLKKGE